MIFDKNVIVSYLHHDVSVSLHYLHSCTHFCSPLWLSLLSPLASCAFMSWCSIVAFKLKCCFISTITFSLKCFGYSGWDVQPGNPENRALLCLADILFFFLNYPHTNMQESVSIMCTFDAWHCCLHLHVYHQQNCDHLFKSIYPL